MVVIKSVEKENAEREREWREKTLKNCFVHYAEETSNDYNSVE